ncbi:Tat pathway signal sequence domain protein [Actinacidiphila acidipaludis]|uniref:Tat pathway signal sequence domain protein n=1 Tax=Actinacidiphila acidipaludis TaxID=2873382 RepID=A0ABS7QCI8_9ACTN|nr:Tat pathway signal sequence domain protein [Streptomyces acidipaludis]MBY8880866.1 Tat pathway signal sequence domain protein [Streptomyces acidipaludis]
MTEQGEDHRSGQQDGARARTLRRALWGAATAVAATVAMIAVTLPRGASAHGGGSDGTASAARPGHGAAGSAAVTEDAAPQGPQTGDGPLTKAEVDRARSIALSHGTPRDFRTAEGTQGAEYLDTDLVDPPDDAPGGPRRVEVLSYDYGHDRLVKQTVNLDTGTVERTDTATGVQPPPSRDETRQAAALLIKDPLGQGLRTDFSAATKGRTLTSPDQLRLRGMSFSTGEQSAPAGLDKCGTNRCVRLFTQVGNGPWIDTTDYVIDLSDRTVGRIH